jgi:hypothetical protein
MSDSNNCYDLKDAAHLFGIAELHFYKILRGESEKYPLNKKWIHSAKTALNKPVYWAVAAGFLTTETRYRRSHKSKNVRKPYVVTVITRLGIDALEKQLGIASALPPLVLPLTEATAISYQQTPQSQAAQEERAKCLEELAAMGIPLDKAS